MLLCSETSNNEWKLFCVSSGSIWSQNYFFQLAETEAKSSPHFWVQPSLWRTTPFYGKWTFPFWGPLHLARKHLSCTFHTKFLQFHLALVLGFSLDLFFPQSRGWQWHSEQSENETGGRSQGFGEKSSKYWKPAKMQRKEILGWKDSHKWKKQGAKQDETEEEKRRNRQSQHNHPPERPRKGQKTGSTNWTICFQYFWDQVPQNWTSTSKQSGYLLGQQKQKTPGCEPKETQKKAP